MVRATGLRRSRFTVRRSDLTGEPLVIRYRITMSAKTSIRDLRNHFPKVRRLVETQGEVLLTEKGQPRYRLTLYSPASEGVPPPVDYWARLNAYQPKALTEAQSSALQDEIRGDR
jgi:antitoxin (DNA-binding transcriptional repressor) of toxin-antitoxin stability system